jgi:uncharacterized protein Yka (UPF0111/DUF47 family)
MSEIGDAIGKQIGAFTPEHRGDMDTLAARIDAVPDAMSLALRQLQATLGNGMPIAPEFLRWLDERATAYDHLGRRSNATDAHLRAHAIWEPGTGNGQGDVTEAINRTIGSFTPEQPGDMDKLIGEIDSVDNAMAGALRQRAEIASNGPVGRLFVNEMRELAQAYESLAGETADMANRQAHPMWTG